MQRRLNDHEGEMLPVEPDEVAPPEPSGEDGDGSAKEEGAEGGGGEGGGEEDTSATAAAKAKLAKLSALGGLRTLVNIFQGTPTEEEVRRPSPMPTRWQP